MKTAKNAVQTDQNQSAQTGVEVTDLNRGAVPAETKSVSEEVNGAIVNLIAGRESAEIPVDEIMKAIDNKYSRTEVLDVLRASKIGKFIVGRKSMVSRLVYGKMADQKPVKTQIHKRHYRRHVTPKIVTNGSERVIRVRVGPAEIFLPISLALTEQEIAA